MVAGRGLRPSMGEYTTNDEVDHNAAHMAQEVRDRHQRARLRRLLDRRIAAVRLQSRARSSPDEIRAANAGIPEVAQLGRDARLHLLNYLGVPSRLGHRVTLLANQPDRRSQRCPTMIPNAALHFSCDGPTTINDKSSPNNGGDKCFPSIGMLMSKNND